MDQSSNQPDKKCFFCKKSLKEIDSNSEFNRYLHLQMCEKRPEYQGKKTYWKQTKLKFFKKQK